jgi:hypothetical protein
MGSLRHPERRLSSSNVNEVECGREESSAHLSQPIVFFQLPFIPFAFANSIFQFCLIGGLFH